MSLLGAALERLGLFRLGGKGGSGQVESALVTVEDGPAVLLELRDEPSLGITLEDAARSDLILGDA